MESKQEILSPFFLCLLAVLPVLPLTLTFDQAFRTGWLTAAVYGVTALLANLKADGKGLHQKDLPINSILKESALLALIILAAVAAGVHFDQPPFWSLSVYLLLISSTGINAKAILARAAGFFALILYLGLFQGFFYQKKDWGVSYAPAAAFLLLFIAALIWKNQPGKKPEGVK